jgi:hypothetical protein
MLLLGGLQDFEEGYVIESRALVKIFILLA